jgi:CRP-like cAMP-binding protein
MKKIYDSNQVKTYLKKCRFRSIFEALHIDLFLMEYHKGELVTSPFQEEQLFQTVVSGSLNIYFIRDDGTRYSLSIGNTDYILGDMECFYPRSSNVFVEATEDVLCVSFLLNQNRERLLADNAFLKLVCNSLCQKMGVITTMDAAPASLTERVISYMNYKCSNRTFTGLEKAAFHLHCSSRQLQRVMNRCIADGIVNRLGKGTYQLISNPPQ